MEFSMSRPCERRDPSVSAIALIAAARTLVSALEQRPFVTFEARGDGSLRSQGRPLRDCANGRRFRPLAGHGDFLLNLARLIVIGFALNPCNIPSNLEPTRPT